MNVYLVRFLTLVRLLKEGKSLVRRTFAALSLLNSL